MNNLPKRKLNRLFNYNYSDEGIYFVTICSKDRKNIFSKIDKKTVGTALAAVRNSVRNPVGNSIYIKLTGLGKIINNHWCDIPNQFNNINVDEFIVMPNHIHGIIIVDKWTGASPVPTLSKIIGSFKSKSSVEYLKFIKQNNLNISGQIWQRSYHDHIIRNEKSLQEIREYIINNPLNWETDKNNINKNS